VTKINAITVRIIDSLRSDDPELVRQIRLH